MLPLGSLILLYVSQLIYVLNRWINETISMSENARQARVRKAIDWTTSSPRRA
jgi:hypothetical protein